MRLGRGAERTDAPPLSISLVARLLKLLIPEQFHGCTDTNGQWEEVGGIRQKNPLKVGKEHYTLLDRGGKKSGLRTRVRKVAYLLGVLIIILRILRKIFHCGGFLFLSSLSYYSFLPPP